MKLHIKGSTGSIITYAHVSTSELVFKYFWRQVYVFHLNTLQYSV